MDTKLTIKLDEYIIQKAKIYAKARKTSLSKLIEEYFQRITNGKEPENEITPLVKSLSGIINLPKGYDHKKDYAKHLAKKYK